MPVFLRPDLILPRPESARNGWSGGAGRNYKSDPDLKLIPVVILTTSAADELDVLRSYNTATLLCGSKPLDVHQFIQRSH